ncbi:MAG: succinyl-diaminopimelate desuccinylase [Beggiatoa sp. IS2]|nr:MAG: succinyl-diaminopimelate desuccinylase [Beggiatoa sp. IS2]
MSKTLELAIDLVSRASLTPEDAGCQSLIAHRLQQIGFEVEFLRFGEVDNVWARRGKTSPLFVFAGHTDVVPPGPVSAWRFPPFTPTVHDGFLYGRGTADMKGSVAAMVTACERFVAQYPDYTGSIAFLLTSDEEGPSVNGTIKVIEWLQARGETIDWCIVGEPSGDKRVADTIKNGRRGVLHGHLTVQGIQGHIAYPHLADNPIHRFAPVAQALCQMQWDQGNEFFSPTSFQIYKIHADTGAMNVIPGELEVVFNFRYSTAVTHTQLQERVIALLESYQLNYRLRWEHTGLPFLTAPHSLVTTVQQAIKKICGYDAPLSTSGGTSDGRFIAPTGAQVVEIGPVNATIHKVDERVRVDELDTLSILYQYILEKLMLNS